MPLSLPLPLELLFLFQLQEVLWSVPTSSHFSADYSFKAVRCGGSNMPVDSSGDGRNLLSQALFLPQSHQNAAQLQDQLLSPFERCRMTVVTTTLQQVFQPLAFAKVLMNLHQSKSLFA